MRSKSQKVFGLALCLALAGCAHSAAVDRKVDRELGEEPQAVMGGNVAQESRRIIGESPDLKPEQKLKLLALHARVAGEINQIRGDLGRLKMVFFRTVLSPKAEEAEIQNLKARILRMDRKKTDLMLEALEETRSILGRTSLEDRRLLRALRMEHMTGVGD